MAGCRRLRDLTLDCPLHSRRHCPSLPAALVGGLPAHLGDAISVQQRPERANGVFVSMMLFCCRKTGLLVVGVCHRVLC